MKFVSYKDTVGLDKFPEEDRFIVWKEKDSELMVKNIKYLSRVKRFRLVVLLSTFVLILFSLVEFLFFWKFGLKSGRNYFNILYISLSLVSGLFYTLFILVFSFNLQKYKNERIGKELSKI